MVYIEYYPSKQYLEKISAALGKLEIALKLFSTNISKHEKEYDFSIRQTILDSELLISNLKNPLHKLAAEIQYERGAKIEDVTLIKKELLIGVKIDFITKSKKKAIFTKEKRVKKRNV